MFGVFGSLVYLFIALVVVFIIYVAFSQISKMRTPLLRVDYVGDKYVVVCEDNCSGELIAEDKYGRVVFRDQLAGYQTYDVPAIAKRLYVVRRTARYVYELEQH